MDTSDLLSKIRELRALMTQGEWIAHPWLEDAPVGSIVHKKGYAIALVKNRRYDAEAVANQEVIVLLVNHLAEIEKALEESDG